MTAIALQSFSARASQSRRLRRRPDPLYCSTNGCTTYLEPSADGRSATCPICGLVRPLRA